MITSITLNGEKLPAGVLNIKTSDTIKATCEGQSVSLDVNTTTHDPRLEYYNGLMAGDIKLPYISAISGVNSDQWGRLWLLGGLTTQIDTVDTNTLSICDMAQTVDYPRIYRNVYAMLRQIRLWLDAHKDNLLLDKSDALSQWDAMRSESDWSPVITPPDDVDTSDSYTPAMFVERRSREDIRALGDAVNLLNEYYGVVALWNYAVSRPKNTISSRLHPADSAGVYVGINLEVPVTAAADTNIEVGIRLSYVGQTDTYTWCRMPVVRIVPEAGTISSKLSGTKSESTVGSILDEGNQIKGADVTGSASFTIPAADVRTSHTIQVVMEAIPFYLCGLNEKTYADSKKAERFSATGENVWTIEVVVKRNGHELYAHTSTKRTPYVNTCAPDINEEEEEA